MQYQIYIDTLFVNNFLMNLFLLFLVSKMIRCTATHLSILKGSAIGSLAFCLLILLTGVSGFLKIVLAYGAIGPGMIWYSLRLREKHSLLQGMLYFYGLTFLFGGILQFSFTRIPFFKNTRISTASILVIMGFAFFLLSVFIQEKKKEKRNIFYDVLLQIGNTEVTAKGILDSGNLLYEPISGKPVVIAEEGLLKKYKENGLLKGFCAIPYHSIGKAKGMLEGYVIEELRIKGKGIFIKKENVILALSREKVSATGEYQMILHSKLMEN